MVVSDYSPERRAQKPGSFLMRVIVYNSSSFGGCFDYGKALVQAYKQHQEVEVVKWLVPQNAVADGIDSVQKPFLSDVLDSQSKWKKQLHFLYRVVVNPIILFFFLIKEKPSRVIFNDFEQLTAFFWVPLFRIFLKGKHRFCIILHDPDRDAYPPSLWFSRFSMKKIIGLMDVAIYHDFLPQKVYYEGFSQCSFVDLPHGFFTMPKPDPELFKGLSPYQNQGSTIMAILGNIREEKNYHLAIEALSSLPDHRLIIAGKAANARVNIQHYRDLAVKFKVEDRVIWIEKFLTEEELSAVIEISDVILLNYSVSFTSQSGILNIVAPFRKELIVSDGPSSLASVVRKFGVGELVEPESLHSLIHGLKNLESKELENRIHWEEYLAYASWENHVEKAVSLFKQKEIE